MPAQPFAHFALRCEHWTFRTDPIFHKREIKRLPSRVADCNIGLFLHVERRDRWDSNACRSKCHLKPKRGGNCYSNSGIRTRTESNCDHVNLREVTPRPLECAK